MSVSRRATPLDRLLRLFTDVRSGEGLGAVLLALNVFLILTAYYILKPVREALILGETSAAMKSYLSAAMVFVLIFPLRAYGSLADRLPRRRLINVVTWFFIGCLVLFYGLAQLRVPLGIAFFLWIGIFNVMVVAQFWSFANDVYTDDEGERLFPVVGFGASLGAVLGAWIAAQLIAPLGLYQLMVVAAVILVLSLQITNYIDKKERERTEADLPEEMSTATLTASSAFKRDDIERALREYEERIKGEEGRETGDADARQGTTREESEEGTPTSAEEAEHEGGGQGAFALVFKTRYLLMIGILLLLLNWVNTTGEFILGDVVKGAASEAVAAGQAGGLSEEEYIGEFYSQFFGIVNIAALVIQLFFVSRIIKYLGVQIGLMILPVIALGAYSLIAFYPILTYVRWAKTAENSTDYSLNNTVKNMLFLPCTREQKYKAKQVTDSFFVRAGDFLQAGMVFVGTTFLAWGATGFAKFNIFLVLVWLALAFLIGREYKRLVATGQAPS